MSKDELHAKFNKFGDGQWAELLDEAFRSTTVNVPEICWLIRPNDAQKLQNGKSCWARFREPSSASPGQLWRLELKRRFNQCRNQDRLPCQTDSQNRCQPCGPLSTSDALHDRLPARLAGWRPQDSVASELNLLATRSNPFQDHPQWCLGTPAHCAHTWLALKTMTGPRLDSCDEHERFLTRIPLVRDVQSTWLLLLHCAQARANFLLRAVRPEAVEEFATRHDRGLWWCLAQILGVNLEQCEVGMQEAATLPLVLGSLGLRSAIRTRYSAFWASWADCITMVDARHPEVAAQLVVQLEGHPATPCLGAATAAARALTGS